MEGLADSDGDGIFPDLGAPEYFARYRYWSSDTPQQKFNFTAERYIDEITVNDSFKVFLMYVPPAAEAVPLGIGAWGWQGRLKKDLSGLFLELDGEYSQVPEALDGVASSELPVLSPVVFGADSVVVPVIYDNGIGQSAMAYQYIEAFLGPQ